MGKHWEKASPEQVAWADKHGFWVAPEEDSEDACHGCAALRSHESCEDFPCGSLCDPMKKKSFCMRRVIFKKKETKMNKEKVKIVQILITPNDEHWDSFILGLGSDGVVYASGGYGFSGKGWEVYLPAKFKDEEEEGNE